MFTSFNFLAIIYLRGDCFQIVSVVVQEEKLVTYFRVRQLIETENNNKKIYAGVGWMDGGGWSFKSETDL